MCLPSVYKTRKKCVKIFSLISEFRFNWTANAKGNSQIFFFSHRRALELNSWKILKSRDVEEGKQIRNWKISERSQLEQFEYVWDDLELLELYLEDFWDYLIRRGGRRRFWVRKLRKNYIRERGRFRSGWKLRGSKFLAELEKNNFWFNRKFEDFGVETGNLKA